MQLFRRVRGEEDERSAPSAPSLAHAGTPSTPLVPESSSSAGLTRTFDSLAVPSFRMLWFGMLFSMAAIQMDMVARAWLAYELSGSGLTIGLVTLARGLPQLLLSLVGGIVADRFDKRKVLVITQAGLGILALTNAVLVHLGVIEIWHLVALGLLQGAIFPFTMPVRQAYIPELVGQERLANAIALHSTGMNFNRVLAPGIAGLLIAWQPSFSFYAIAALYVGACLTLLRLPPSKAATTRHRGAVADILTGYDYVRREPTVRTLLGMAFITVLLGMPYQTLLPVFQAEVLHVGPSYLGLMYTAVGVGSLLGSLVIAYFSGYPRKGLLQLIAGIGFGVSLALFALSTVYEVSVALLFFVGLASQGYLTINNMLLMLTTDRKMYGRVTSVYMITWALMPVTLLPMGALVDYAGAPITVAAAGALLAVAIVAITLLSSARDRLDGVGTVDRSK